MNAHFGFLGLMLSSLLMAQSFAFVRRNQDCVHFLDFGTCDGHRLMWGYSIYDRGCIPFPYTGCGGNTNRFRTRLDCETACKK